MSLLMLSSIGLVPVSQVISGAIGAWNFTLLFVSAGMLIVLAAIWTAFQPAMVAFSESLSANNLPELLGKSRQ